VRRGEVSRIDMLVGRDERVCGVDRSANCRAYTQCEVESLLLSKLRVHNMPLKTLGMQPPPSPPHHITPSTENHPFR